MPANRLEPIEKFGGGELERGSRPRRRHRQETELNWAIRQSQRLHGGKPTLRTTDRIDQCAVAEIEVTTEWPASQTEAASSSECDHEADDQLQLISINVARQVDHEVTRLIMRPSRR